MLKNFKKGLIVVSVLFLLLLATSFTDSNVAIAGGFTKECTNFNFPDTNVGRGIFAGDMKADCTKDGTLAPTPPFALSNYVGINNEGQLIWKKSGFYGIFCLNRRMVYEINIDDWRLEANCRHPGVGTRKISKLSINERISNQNGTLVYDGPPL